MGNNECCEEQARGGEFPQTSSRFKPNNIKLEPNRFNNGSNFAELPAQPKIIHENAPQNKFQMSPPFNKFANRRSSEDLPVIPELVSKDKPKEDEANESRGANEPKEIQLKESKHKSEFSFERSNHSSLLQPKSSEHNANTMQLQSNQHQKQPSQPSLELPPQLPNTEKIQEKASPPQLQMPELNQEVRATLQSQNFAQQQFKFQHRRQYGNDFYEGQLDQNERFPNGLGKLYKADHSLFIGHFHKGKAQGEGAFIFADGSYYCGSFSNNMAEGRGVYHSSRLHYEGEFKRNCFHGEGSEKGAAHSFKGEYYNSQKTNGVFTWNEGHQSFEYNGSFDQNMFSGEGTLMESTGTYKGQFIEGKKHGNGTYEYKNGLRYVGEYRDGLRTGKGALYNPNNKLAYEGQFKDGLPHGTGIVLDKNGKRCETRWVEGIDEELL